MRSRSRAAAGLVVGIWLFLSSDFSTYAQTASPNHGTVQEEAVVPAHARGSFEVELTPLTIADSADTAASKILGRMSADKQIHGDLEATSKGEMLTAMTSVKGSAGYVAIERVSGTLHGRRGTFVLQHSGTMTHGAQQLTITVVPDSGTDELVGLAGKMTITIVDGKHSYDLEYTLGD